MERRHFLVQEMNGEYQLREIETALADGINQFGCSLGTSHVVEKSQWTFYFMNSTITQQRAQEIATHLAQEFLSGERR